MIKNFEIYTSELTEEEERLVKILIEGLPFFKKANPIKEAELCERVNAKYNTKLNGVRLRKIVNHIRTNALLPLIATSSGYYVSYDSKIIEEQILSLEQRAKSILRCVDGLKKYL